MTSLIWLLEEIKKTGLHASILVADQVTDKSNFSASDIATSLIITAVILLQFVVGVP